MSGLGLTGLIVVGRILLNLKTACPRNCHPLFSSTFSLCSVNDHLSPMQVRLPQTPRCEVCDVPKGQVGTSGAICRNCAFGASQTFPSNVCASP